MWQGVAGGTKKEKRDVSGNIHIQYLVDTYMLTQRTNRSIKGKASLRADWHQQGGYTISHAQRSQIWLPRMSEQTYSGFTHVHIKTDACNYLQNFRRANAFCNFNGHANDGAHLPSSFRLARNGRKSIKKCKWRPQLVYIINFIHNTSKNIDHLDANQLSMHSTFAL